MSIEIFARCDHCGLRKEMPQVDGEFQDLPGWFEINEEDFCSQFCFEQHKKREIGQVAYE